MGMEEILGQALLNTSDANTINKIHRQIRALSLIIFNAFVSIQYTLYIFLLKYNLCMVGCTHIR